MLSDQAHTIHGGCSCAAIRYRVEVPRIDERPWYVGSTDAHKLKMPFTVACHCNHCRRATGQLPMTGLEVPFSYLFVRFAPIDEPVVTLDEEMTRKARAEEADKSGWRPATEVLHGDATLDPEKTWLRRFWSSPARARSFCGRCGTNLFYQIHPAPPMENWVDMLDIMLGTVDRENLQQVALRPEVQVWMDYSFPWLTEVSKKGYSGACYPAWKLDASYRQ